MSISKNKGFGRVFSPYAVEYDAFFAQLIEARCPNQRVSIAPHRPAMLLVSGDQENIGLRHVDAEDRIRDVDSVQGMYTDSRVLWSRMQDERYSPSFT